MTGPLHLKQCEYEYGNSIITGIISHKNGNIHICNNVLNGEIISDRLGFKYSYWLYSSGYEYSGGYERAVFLRGLRILDEADLEILD